MDEDNSSSQSPVSSSSDDLLLCQETEINFSHQEMEDDPFPFDSFMSTSFVGFQSESEDEYIQVLLQREKTGFSVDAEDAGRKSESLIDQSSRLDAIDYILTARAALGFHFQTAYLSIIFFDRFLSRRTIDIEKKWAIQLLSVACLSLAAKLEECKVPVLSDFLIGCFKFESRSIQRMELLVLDTMDWKLGLVTPLAFLPCFIRHFSSTNRTLHLPSGAIVSKTTELIWAFLKDVNLMNHLSSSIACATVLVALHQRLLTRTDLELKINAIPWDSDALLNIEDISTCYATMQQLQIRRVPLSELVLSPDLSASDLRLMYTSLATAPSTSTKRKRLTFNEINEKGSGHLSDKKRHHLD